MATLHRVVHLLLELIASLKIFFERVPARDPQVKALFPEKVISEIENDIGCKIKMEEKFITVSGKDRLILAKGVDAVHNIKNEGEKKVGSSSNMIRSRSPEVRSPVGSRLGRSDSQRSNPSPRNASRYNQRFSREKNIEERVREDAHKLLRGSPQARAFGSDGARGRSTHSKSPAHRPQYTAGAHSPYGGQSQNREVHRNTRDNSTFQQTLEELQLEYTRDAMEITQIRDKEEDEENNRHREVVSEMRENNMKRFSMMRAMHEKQWEEFLQVDAQRRQQRAHQHSQHMAATEFRGYKQDSYSEQENPVGNPYNAASMPMDLRVRYPDVDNHPSSRSHDSYGDFQRQRHEDYGKSYNNRY